MEEAVKTYDILREQGYEPTLVNARFVKPIDFELIDELVKEHSLLCTMEENVATGGYGNLIAAYLYENGVQIQFVNISIKDIYVQHGKVDELRKVLNMDAQSVVDQIVNKINKK